MSTDAQQLELFDDLSYYEGADVEYKSARGGLPGSLWETYSAFANTSGGSIWLGVSQKGNTLVVEGIDKDIAEKYRGDVWNLANNRQKISRNLLTEDDVRVVSTPTPGKALIFVKVPRASRRDRPVFVGNDPFTGTYRRNHEGDFRCNNDEVRRMFADQSDEPADSRILEGFGMGDLHQDSLRQFRARFGSANPSHPWLSEPDLGLLVKLGGWRKDRLSGKEGLTLAGLLMFGQEHAIRDPAAVPGFQLDYRERFSDDPNIRWTDRLTLDGTWEGNLFQFYQQVMLKLSIGPGIKTPFQINAEGYRRTATSVHEALQEALVNALIHADYSGQGGIVLDRYLDHLEFSNPGTLLLSREQLLRGGVSECRNKSLQLMFQLAGAGDKAGSGIDKIRQSWAAQYWQSPQLRETFRPDRVQLILPMLSTLPREAMQQLEQRFGPAVKERSPDEIQALVTAQVEGGVTNQRLQEMLAQHPVDITRMLRGLVHDGFLLSEGQGRWTKYSLPAPSASPGHLARSPDELSRPPLGASGSSPDLPGSPPDLPRSPLDLTSSSPDLPRSPPDLPSADSDQELLRIAAPVRESGKASAKVVKGTILALCARRYLSLRDLSALLGRNQESLRNSYVTSMVSEGLLELRYPQAPSHPDQAYRARQEDTGGIDG